MHGHFSWFAPFCGYVCPLLVFCDRFLRSKLPVFLLIISVYLCRMWKPRLHSTSGWQLVQQKETQSISHQDFHPLRKTYPKGVGQFLLRSACLTKTCVKFPKEHKIVPCLKIRLGLSRYHLLGRQSSCSADAEHHQLLPSMAAWMQKQIPDEISELPDLRAGDGCDALKRTKHEMLW